MRISSLQRPAGQDHHQVDRAGDPQQGQDGKWGGCQAKMGVGHQRNVLPDCKVINRFDRLPDPKCVQIFFIC